MTPVEKPVQAKCSHGSTCPHVEEAAEIAVKKVFAILGVNIDDPEKVEEFRMDLRFGRSLRRASDKGLMTAVGLLVTGLGLAMYYGLMQKLGGHQ